MALEPVGQIGLVRQIGEMDGAALGDGEAGGASARAASRPCPNRRRPSALRDAPHHVSLDQIDGDRFETEQALAGFENGLEDRRRVRDGTADDLQDVGGRGLPLQRLLGFVEQPRVLDRDDRLIAERFGLRDLLGAETVGRVAPTSEQADAVALAQAGAGRAPK